MPAAACSVTWAMPWVALETSSELAACCTVAVAISAILAAVALTLSTIFFSASPVSPLSCAPCCDLLRRFLDEAGDLAGRLVGPLGQLADLVGHHGESPAVLAGPGRLDGRVQGQQVGLAGDLGDHLDDLADLRGTGADQFHGLDRLLHGRPALLGQDARFLGQLVGPVGRCP